MSRVGNILEEVNKIKILDKIVNYRKWRRNTIFLLIGSFSTAILGSFLTDYIGVIGGVIAFLGFISFFLAISFIWVNGSEICPRCGKTFCEKGFYISYFAQKCLHCGLNLRAENIDEL